MNIDRFKGFSETFIRRNSNQQLQQNIAKMLGSWSGHSVHTESLCMCFIHSFLYFQGSKRFIKPSFWCVLGGQQKRQWYSTTSKDNWLPIFKSCWNWCSRSCVFNTADAFETINKRCCLHWYKSSRPKNSFTEVLYSSERAALIIYKCEIWHHIETLYKTPKRNDTVLICWFCIMVWHIFWKM